MLMTPQTPKVIERPMALPAAGPSQRQPLHHSVLVAITGAADVDSNIAARASSARQAPRGYRPQVVVHRPGFRSRRVTGPGICSWLSRAMSPTTTSLTSAFSTADRRDVTRALVRLPSVRVWAISSRIAPARNWIRQIGIEKPDQSREHLITPESGWRGTANRAAMSVGGW